MGAVIPGHQQGEMEYVGRGGGREGRGVRGGERH